MFSPEVILLNKKFATDAGKFAATAFKVVKEAAIWCGHVLKVLWVDYLVPAMKFIWPYIVSAASFIGRMLITAPGLGTLGLLAGVSASAACFAWSETHHLQGPGHRGHRLLFQIAAIAFAVLGGAAFATGIILGIS